MTTGSNSTFIGRRAGHTTNADNNIAIGRSAFEDATSAATNNVVIGNTSGFRIQGDENTAVGNSTLEDCTSGNQNTAIGYQALKELTTGTQNVAIGSFSLRDVTSGAENTALGDDAGVEVSTGSNNTLLGNRAGRTGSPSGQITTGSNNVVLGDNSVSNLFCADTSISSSDSRDKTDVSDFTIGLDWIKALRPVTYRWDRRTWYGTDEKPYGTPDGSKKRARLHVGFLAQEALEVEKANGYGNSNDDSLILNLTDDGMSYGMKYERLIPMLVNAVKELSAEVTALKAA